MASLHLRSRTRPHVGSDESDDEGEILRGKRFLGGVKSSLWYKL